MFFFFKGKKKGKNKNRGSRGRGFSFKVRKDTLTYEQMMSIADKCISKRRLIVYTESI